MAVGDVLARDKLLDDAQLRVRRAQLHKAAHGALPMPAARLAPYQ